MIKYAVVGAGWITQEAFLPGVAQSGNSRVEAIVSGNSKKSAALARMYDIPLAVSYDEYDSLLQSDRIDAVYVALPNSLHAEYAIRAARAGKHVIVEKPLANTETEAEAMIAAAKDGGVYLMTAYRLHNEPGTLAVLDRIRSGEIGKPLVFQSIFSFQAQPDNHRLVAEHWGGPLQDVGVYCINAARHIFSEEPIEATAISYRPTDDDRFKEVDATIAATLRFPSGGLAQFVASFGVSSVDAYRVVGSTGNLELGPGFRHDTPTTLRLRRNGESIKITFPQVDHLGGHMAYFSDCITSHTPPEPDGEEGLADMRVLFAVEEAARTGKPVSIKSSARPRHPTSDMEQRRPVAPRLLIA
ncbi:Gfo/Idh/MocA family protein [Aestuariivirga sp.]|uniref:Gfo/Idh/MocA family protein n=1 Tax=Aestuariivirga sp. TaxID=2650926 RepID=UPI003BAC3681